MDKYIITAGKDVVYSCAAMDEALINKSDELRFDNVDLIVLCKFTGLRQPQHDVSLSQIKIDKVYKGDPEYAGTEVYVYEPLNYIYKQNIFSTLGEGYVPMTEGREYILLIDKKVFPPEKKLNEEETKLFLLHNLSDRLFSFSKFMLSEDGCLIADDSVMEYNYNEIKNYEVIVSTEEIRKSFYLIKQKIINLYGIGSEVPLSDYYQ